MNASSHIKVLLIDDDEDDYHIIREVFRDIPNSKFKVDWESGFEGARKQIKKQAHDIYLIDYRLGEKTGLDLFQEMKALGFRKPMIVLTGVADQEVDQAAMHAGAADYLVKAQVTPHLLERSIRYAIHRAEMETQILTQDRLASIGLLASGLAHDIGTPLGVVRGRTEYVTMKIKDCLPPKNIPFTENAPSVLKDLDVIISEIDRVSHLVTSMLSFARGGSSENPGTMSVTEATSSVAMLLQNEFQKRGIRLENMLPADKDLAVKGESDRFQQVLLNLFINAMHAIDVAIKKGRSGGHFIRVECEENEDSYSILIQDSGCGVSKKNMTHLFKPFFTTKEPGRGTGLGLVTAGWLVQLWGGKITVESQENVGTRFKIKLMKVIT